MTTMRECVVLLATGLVCAAAAAGENFKCDQAARFGYADSLCEPAQSRIAPIVPFAKPDAAKDSTAFDSGEAHEKFTDQAQILRQSARANRRSWDNYGSWNPASPVFPRGTFPGGEWSPLRFPPVGVPEASAPSAQEGRAIKH